MSPSGHEPGVAEGLQAAPGGWVRQHVHYKVCSTFDSSPAIGSIGRVSMDSAAGIFKSPFIPLVVAVLPALGRHCVFGNLFARMPGIGSRGEIHRLDRHPAMRYHPITPADESDLRRHLARQTKKKIALFDILQLALLERRRRRRVQGDSSRANRRWFYSIALYTGQMGRIGKFCWMRRLPAGDRCFPWVPPALKWPWVRTGRPAVKAVRLPWKITTGQAGIGRSGEAVAVASDGKQIAWALKHGFGGVALDTPLLAAGDAAMSRREITQATAAADKLVQAGRSVIVHTALGADDVRRRRTQAAFRRRGLGEQAMVAEAGAKLLRPALGAIFMRCITRWQRGKVKRICIAGGGWLPVLPPGRWELRHWK